jgi:uncharacterized radical SAM superfamily protein
LIMESQGRLEELLARARAISWSRFGKRVTLCLPGMFLVDGKRGHYPAISITGHNCTLGCDHCRGKILEPMYRAGNSRELLELCMRLEQEGALGCLITGGSDHRGRLPWERFLEGVEAVKVRTGLHVSVHSGMVNDGVARALREAGVDQALVDVVGARETWASVMHLQEGRELLEKTLEALYGCGLQVVPHIVAGIQGGRILGESKAMEILGPYPVEFLVWVAFMPLRGTPLGDAAPASPQEVAGLIAESRIRFPEARIHLGCARPRGRKRLELERLALEAGVQRIALYSEETVKAAEELGLEVEFQPTCCSVPIGSVQREESGVREEKR